ncbi:MAG: hypothetical protein C0392_09100 [Syntrophus sp. (in: bacteria)]|nr:hypothetical protein [Syntrophus sp. (in: bacteria)]
MTTRGQAIYLMKLDRLGKKEAPKMKRLTILVMALLLLAGVVHAKDYEVSKKAGEYGVLIKMDRNPPVAGNNNVEITVTDVSGKVVTDAKVVFNYSMAPMPGMPAANYKTDTQPAGMVYKAKVNYSMAGPWSNEVKITRGGKTVTAKFTIDAK